ncbi:GGDEF domain-containing protein [Aliidiomarina celeris]|uniref:GGDEF domain-containing protein n=1 Tax=Aliidiomarina celeris TaxID=2249428 RepID=UPI000DE970FD|nr:GGDEF domain-containing protein [Aliidiomarina celeris]
MTGPSFIDPERHQKTLLRVTLAVVISLSLLAGSINVFFLDSFRLAFFNGLSISFATLISLYYWRSQNLKIASWALISTILFNLIAVMLIAKGGAYSLMWVTVLPPFAFFLLGRKAGAWVTAITFISAVIYMYFQMPHSKPRPLTVGALLNVIEVLIVHFFMFLHYERSRADAYREVEKMSMRDRLTGLYNRGKLDKELAHALAHLKRNNQPLSIILVDIDHFKQVNDKHGHLSGDLVLEVFAKLLLAQRREIDIIGRWGGEEFLIICPNTDKKEAAQFAERLRSAVRDQTIAEQINISASFGVTEASGEHSAELIVNEADQALYQAKALGRDQVAVYASS